METMRQALLTLVALVWAVTILAPIFVPSYSASLLVDGPMLILMGYMFRHVHNNGTGGGK
jgi:hypothetical protein